jgi:murein DD-endopeptidase MepM/ murein hydrolase activator NlpD
MKTGIIFSRELLLSLLCGCTIAISGCGSGNEPFSMLQDPSGVPGLSIPLPVNTFASVTGFGAQSAYTGGGITDGFEFNYTTFSGQPNVTAPGPGTVTQIDPNLDAGLYAVTIFHNAHLTSRVSRISAVTVRTGDFVNTGEVIGTLGLYTVISTLPRVRLAVYVDGGAATCPLSYLTATARAQFTSSFGGNFPCPQ